VEGGGGENHDPRSWRKSRLQSWDIYRRIVESPFPRTLIFEFLITRRRRIVTSVLGKYVTQSLHANAVN